MRGLGGIYFNTVNVTARREPRQPQFCTFQYFVFFSLVFCAYWLLNSLDDSGTLRGVPPAAVTDNERREWTELMRQEFGRLPGLWLGPQAGRAFRELFELCSAQGLPTAMVLMPEGSEVREQYSRDGLAEIRRFTDAIGLEHHARAIDRREWIDDRDFIDGHHLLASGAAAFTERLGQAIEKTLLR